MDKIIICLIFSFYYSNAVVQETLPANHYLPYHLGPCRTLKETQALGPGALYHKCWISTSTHQAPLISSPHQQNSLAVNSNNARSSENSLISFNSHYSQGSEVLNVQNKQDNKDNYPNILWTPFKLIKPPLDFYSNPPNLIYYNANYNPLGVTNVLSLPTTTTESLGFPTLPEHTNNPLETPGITSFPPILATVSSVSSVSETSIQASTDTTSFATSGFTVSDLLSQPSVLAFPAMTTITALDPLNVSSVSVLIPSLGNLVLAPSDIPDLLSSPFEITSLSPPSNSFVSPLPDTPAIEPLNSPSTFDASTPIQLLPAQPISNSGVNSFNKNDSAELTSPASLLGLFNSPIAGNEKQDEAFTLNKTQIIPVNLSPGLVPSAIRSVPLVSLVTTFNDTSSQTSNGTPTIVGKPDPVYSNSMQYIKKPNLEKPLISSLLSSQAFSSHLGERVANISQTVEDSKSENILVNDSIANLVPVLHLKAQSPESENVITFNKLLPIKEVPGILQSPNKPIFLVNAPLDLLGLDKSTPVISSSHGLGVTGNHSQNPAVLLSQLSNSQTSENFFGFPATTESLKNFGMPTNNMNRFMPGIKLMTLINEKDSVKLNNIVEPSLSPNKTCPEGYNFHSSLSMCVSILPLNAQQFNTTENSSHPNSPLIIKPSIISNKISTLGSNKETTVLPAGSTTFHYVPPNEGIKTFQNHEGIINNSKQITSLTTTQSPESEIKTILEAITNNQSNVEYNDMAGIKNLIKSEIIDKESQFLEWKKTFHNTTNKPSKSNTEAKNKSINERQELLKSNSTKKFKNEINFKLNCTQGLIYNSTTKLCKSKTSTALNNSLITNHTVTFPEEYVNDGSGFYSINHNSSESTADELLSKKLVSVLSKNVSEGISLPHNTNVNSFSVNLLGRQLTNDLSPKENTGSK